MIPFSVMDDRGVYRPSWLRWQDSGLIVSMFIWPHWSWIGDDPSKHLRHHRRWVIMRSPDLIFPLVIAFQIGLLAWFVSMLFMQSISPSGLTVNAWHFVPFVTTGVCFVYFGFVMPKRFRDPRRRKKPLEKRIDAWTAPPVRLRARPSTCLACMYSLDGVVPESDGCTVCPECGAAWLVGEEVQTWDMELDTSDKRRP